MFAVIQTGGKQYAVSKGQTLTIEKLPQDSGKFTFDEVLLLGGEKVMIGKPHIAGAKVEASIIEHGRGEKIIVRKYKAKVRYRRKNGHRQSYTKVKIENIVAPK